MTPEEASEIIAKFMGYKKLDPPTKTSRFNIRWVKGKKRMSSLDFHRSLDSLVPVWEKLYKEWDLPFQYMTMQWQQSLVNCQWKPTIQEAAAIATAKSIQEMGK